MEYQLDIDMMDGNGNSNFKRKKYVPTCSCCFKDLSSRFFAPTVINADGTCTNCGRYAVFIEEGKPKSKANKLIQ